MAIRETLLELKQDLKQLIVSGRKNSAKHARDMFTNTFDTFHAWIEGKADIDPETGKVRADQLPDISSEYVYPESTPPIPVKLSGGRTAGKYVNGQFIPIAGKTHYQITKDIYSEFFPATVNMNSIASPVELNESRDVTVAGNLTLNDETIIVSRRILKNGVEWQTFQGNSYSFPDTINASTTYTVAVEVGNNGAPATITASRTITYSYPNYFGYSTSASLTVAEIVAQLTSKTVSDSRNRTVNGVTATGGKYTYYAYRAAAGDLSGIIQDGAAPVLGAFSKLVDVSGVNAFGAAITLRVYRSNAPDAFSNNSLAFS